MCWQRAGLPTTAAPHLTLGAPCATRQTLIDAAQDSLEVLAASIVGVWAARWTAAGVSLDELDAITECFTGSNMSSEYAQRHRRDTLRHLRRLHAAPTFKRTLPARLTLCLDDLPTLTGDTLADPARGERPYFLDSEGRAHSLPLGLDSLTIPQPDGSALLIFTTGDGQPDPARGWGFRVIAGLLPTVQAALNANSPSVPF